MRLFFLILHTLLSPSMHRAYSDADFLFKICFFCFSNPVFSVSFTDYTLFSHGLYGFAFMRSVINLIEVLTDRD